jgi:hypothetical protein
MSLVKEGATRSRNYLMSRDMAFIITHPMDMRGQECEEERNGVNESEQRIERVFIPFGCAQTIWSHEI